MNELGTVASDLAFLRRRVEGGRESPPATIFYLWGGIVATGGTLTDLSPTVANVFWVAGGVLGVAASFWLGFRWSTRLGSRRPGSSLRHGLHWGGLVVAAFLMGFAEGPRSTSPNAFGARILFIVGLAYYYAGVHIHRVFFWVAGLQAAGYVAIILLPGTPWSVVGLTIAAGLVGSGVAIQTASRRGSTAPLRLEA